MHMAAAWLTLVVVRGTWMKYGSASVAVVSSACTTFHSVAASYCASAAGRPVTSPVATSTHSRQSGHVAVVSHSCAPV
jgi:hypothetical protein